MLKRLFAVFAVLFAALCLSTAAIAQGEPSLKQVYEAAQSGHLEEAQQMMRQVIQQHPNSAKAHYVVAELYAKQYKNAEARASLAKAEELAPGLPFAKPEAVKALKASLSARAAGATTSGQGGGISMGNASSGSNVSSGGGGLGGSATPARYETSGGGSSIPWGLLIAGAIGVGAVFMFMRRRSPPAGYDAPAAYGPGGVPAGGGLPPGYGPVAGQPGYGQPGYGPGYPQQQGSGMGGRIMGGVATGLAVGAGVLAAQQIGKHLMGDDAHAANRNTNFDNAIAPDVNDNMGGSNFGISDASSWDGGGGDVGGGGGDGGWDS